MNVLNYALISVGWLILTIIFHELGHFVVAKIRGFKSRFGFDKLSFFVETKGYLTPVDDLNITFGGLFLGYVPCFCLFYLPGFSSLGLVFVVALTVGCWSEWKRYVLLSKSKNE